MSTTLFAYCAVDGPDALFDALDDLSRDGVADSEWEWLRWRDHLGREFVVIRGSLSSRGAFAQCSSLRSIRLSVADTYAHDGRAEWLEPRSAQDGRDTLGEWMASPGISPLTVEVIAAVKAQPDTAVAPPLVLRGRERLAAIATPITSSTHAERGHEQHSSRTEPRGDSGSHKGRSQHGARGAQPASSKSSNGVLEAFGYALSNARDKDGQPFSLYRLNTPDAETGD